MAVSFLMGIVESKSVAGFEWLQNIPKLQKDRIVYIGLRDVDEPERKIIKDLGITAFTMFELDKYGIGKVMEMALDQLDQRPIHLSVDIDSVDPFLAPSTGTKVRGGLTFREAHYICEATYESGM